MLEKIKLRLEMFGWCSLIAIAIIGSIVSGIIHYNIKYKDVKEYNHKRSKLWKERFFRCKSLFEM